LRGIESVTIVAMGLSIHITLLVLLAAVMHASWNAIAKSGASKLLDITTMAVAAGAICAAALPFLPAPERASWPWLSTSVLLHVFYFVALAGAYRWGDLSHAYPLMRGIAPLLVALFGALLLEDTLSVAMWIGVLLISTGILLPFLLRPAVIGMPGRGTLFALSNAAIIASYTLVDGQGTRLSASPVAYSLWLFTLNAFPLAALALACHGGGVWRHMRQRWAPGAIGGFLTIASYTIVLWAMTRAPIAAVAALRETSVIFAALIGTVLLKEQMGRPRITGAVVVACGIAALRL
jgi:drug/metabolite transporter (DMT)-like permease